MPDTFIHELKTEAVGHPPGPPGAPDGGLVREFTHDALTFFDRVTESYGDIVYIPDVDVYVVTDPEFVKRMLIDDDKNFSKNAEKMEKISPAIGKGLSTLVGAEWKKHRRLANPAFTMNSVSTFFDIFRQSVRETMTQWDALDGTEIDVTEEMKRLTLRVVIRCLFSTDIDAFSTEIIHSFELLQAYAVARLWTPHELADPDEPRVRSYHEAQVFMENLIDGIIADRRERPDVSRTDLLSLLMSSRDPETGETLGDEKIRHDVMNMFLAGHETTANAVAFGFYLLATHTHVADRLRGELDGADLDALDHRTLFQLGLTDRIFKESLRLYPSSWAMSRLCLSDYVYKGYLIPKGADILIAQWCLHRSPRHWDDPSAFEPDRFLAEGFEKVHKFAYLPFGGGARKCIGMHLADAEGRMILAMLAQAYVFTPTGNTRLNLKARLFMTADPGVRLHIARRV